MLGNRGSGFDTGWLLTNFIFFFNLVDKNSLIEAQRRSALRDEKLLLDFLCCFVDFYRFAV